MCGICGKFTLKEKVHSSLIGEMCTRIAHRGPDDEGVYVDSVIGLGNRRLAILDLSTAGHQPMSAPGGNLWITYNGEIYNHRALQEELKHCGHQFRSKTDTEVVLAAYQSWGPACLNRFNGMFAIGIWDTRHRRLFLARDRIGIKPLYYYFDGYTFLFASEMKAILADPLVPRQLNPEAIANYFTFGHSVAPDTIFHNIKKVPPGHYLICEPDNGDKLQLRIHRYWSLPVPGLTSEDAGEEYYAERVNHLLEESVRRRLISDVPLGVFLSGGIDSSTITALMAKLTPGRVKTFSIGFATEDTAYNELKDARAVAHHFDTEHHELVLDEKDLVGILPNLVRQFDEPFGDAASFPTYLLSEFARKHVTVALSGEGSDEVFGGYRRYVAEGFFAKYPAAVGLLNTRLAQVMVRAVPKLRRWQKLLDALGTQDPIRRYASWLWVFNDEMKAGLFSPNLAQELLCFDPLEIYRRLCPRNGAQTTDRLLYLDQKTWLPDTYLEKVDKTSMGVGLEVRVPFLDHELVEFAATIPAHYKVRGFSTKYILKKAVAPLLPAQTLRKRKHGFAVPLDPWIAGSLRGFVGEVLFDPRARSRGLFNYDYIDKLYRWHVEGKGSYHRHLWLLMVFELWCQQYLDSRPGALAASAA